MGLPYPNDEDRVELVAGESFTARLKRLGIDLQGMARDLTMPPAGQDVYGGERTRALAQRSLKDRPFKERLDAIFRGAVEGADAIDAKEERER